VNGGTPSLVPRLHRSRKGSAASTGQNSAPDVEVICRFDNSLLRGKLASLHRSEIFERYTSGPACRDGDRHWPRRAKNSQDGSVFCSFLPGVSASALKSMRASASLSGYPPRGIKHPAAKTTARPTFRLAGNRFTLKSIPLRGAFAHARLQVASRPVK
jgi:hypothetical protein